ncbi:hypothetical protein E2C01_091681 [Portunus trituberculatus]|uniref:Uncharacterized protein n=1 Tax=Portunus trituberculatus TaxID=210409 RepID=A0A5B7JPR3_PORTR|nr:hypothetical protein [Portunus trituberculatus]
MPIFLVVTSDSLQGVPKIDDNHSTKHDNSRVFTRAANSTPPLPHTFSLAACKSLGTSLCRSPN